MGDVGRPGRQQRLGSPGRWLFVASTETPRVATLGWGATATSSESVERLGDPLIGIGRNAHRPSEWVVDPLDDEYQQGNHGRGRGD